MLAVSLVPIILLGQRLIGIGQLGVKTAILELHLGMAERAAGEFRAFTDRVDGLARFVIDAMLKTDWETKQTLLSSMLDSAPELAEASILSADGREVMKALSPRSGGAGELRTYAADPSFLAARSGGRRTVRFHRVSGSPGAVFFYPFRGGLSLRVLAVLEDAPVVRDLKRLGRTGFPVIVDPAGVPVAAPGDVSPDELAAAKNWPVTAAALKAPAAGSSEYSDAGGTAQIGSYAPLPESAGAVIVQQSRDEAFRYALFMRRQALFAVLIFVLAALAAAFLLSRQMTGPVLQLTRAAEKVSAGDFSGRADIRTGDELRDLGETFNRMVAQLRTYSEMQVERIIREQKNTEAILFSTEDGIVMIDDGGRAQLANRKARSVMGVGQDARIEGRPLLELIELPGVRDAVSEVLQSREKNFSREIEASLEHSRRFFKCFSSPITAPGKEAHLGTLVAFYDITLDKELERIKDEFLHSITHDLRNPMGAVKGFVEFLLKEIPGPVNEAQRKMLVSIDRASFRLLGMINNILDIAKMEAGKMELKLGPVNVGETAARVVELLESLGQRKNVKFVLEAPSPVLVEADPSMIERMFTNLIGNAIKFAPEDGTITVHAEADDEKITAFVGDNGEGIPAEYLDRIFEKFEQVKGQKAGGTGLGLTICKHIAEAHLGRIWVESEAGKGARFIFTIPRGLSTDDSGRVVRTGRGAAARGGPAGAENG